MIEMSTGPVWVLWHGGGSYSRPGPEDLEKFDTVEDAAIEAENRLKSSHFAHTFPFVHKPEERALTPAVDETSTMELYLAQPTHDTFTSPINDGVEGYRSECNTCGTVLQLHQTGGAAERHAFQHAITERDELIPDAVLEYDAETDDFQIAEDGDYVTKGPR